MTDLSHISDEELDRMIAEEEAKLSKEKPAEPTSKDAPKNDNLEKLQKRQEGLMGRLASKGAVYQLAQGAPIIGSYTDDMAAMMGNSGPGQFVRKGIEGIGGALGALSAGGSPLEGAEQAWQRVHSYEGDRAEMAKIGSDFQEENPWTSAGLNIAPSFIPGAQIGLLDKLKLTGKVGKIAKPLLEGGLQGGIYTSGMNDATEGDIRIGAGVGAGGSGAISMLGKFGRAINPAVQKAAGNLSRFGEKLTLGQALGGGLANMERFMSQGLGAGSLLKKYKEQLAGLANDVESVSPTKLGSPEGAGTHVRNSMLGGEKRFRDQFADKAENLTDMIGGEDVPINLRSLKFRLGRAERDVGAGNEDLADKYFGSVREGLSPFMKDGSIPYKNVTLLRSELNALKDKQDNRVIQSKFGDLYEGLNKDVFRTIKQRGGKPAADLKRANDIEYSQRQSDLGDLEKFYDPKEFKVDKKGNLGKVAGEAKDYNNFYSILVDKKADSNKLSKLLSNFEPEEQENLMNYVMNNLGKQTANIEGVEHEIMNPGKFVKSYNELSYPAKMVMFKDKAHQDDFEDLLDLARLYEPTFVNPSGTGANMDGMSKYAKMFGALAPVAAASALGAGAGGVASKGDLSTMGEAGAAASILPLVFSRAAANPAVARNAIKALQATVPKVGKIDSPEARQKFMAALIPVYRGIAGDELPTEDTGE